MKIQFLKGVVYFLSLFLLLNLSACRQEEQTTPQENVIVAKVEKPVTRLYFAGTLQPIKTIPVVSPVDGRVDSIHFDYGKNVNENQLLVTISSSQLAEQYQTAVTDYLQKKQAYTNGIESYQGSVALYKAGVLSREAFLTDKNQYENNVLNYFQAKFKLEQILKQTGTSPKEIEGLTLADTNAIHQILTRKFGVTEVRSPGAGVVLFPLSDSSEDKKSGRLRVGNEVKNGQLLLSLGDMSGLSTMVQVSEVSIVRIKAGMPVQITGDAFPGIELKGKITAVSTQANPEQGGGGGSGALSLFNVDIVVPKITPEQAKLIRVGMSAKIELAIQEAAQIVLPVNAVKHKDGQAFVTILDASNQEKDVPVVTGTTTPTGVLIMQGLKEGDRVVIPGVKPT